MNIVMVVLMLIQWRSQFRLRLPSSFLIAGAFVLNVEWNIVADKVPRSLQSRGGKYRRCASLCPAYIPRFRPLCPREPGSRLDRPSAAKSTFIPSPPSSSPSPIDRVTELQRIIQVNGFINGFILKLDVCVCVWWCSAWLWSDWTVCNERFDCNEQVVNCAPNRPREVDHVTGVGGTAPQLLSLQPTGFKRHYRCVNNLAY